MRSLLQLPSVLLLAICLGSLIPPPATAQSPHHGSVSNVTGRIVSVRLSDSLSVKTGTTGRIREKATAGSDTTQNTYATVRVTQVHRPFDGNWTVTCRITQQSRDVVTNDPVQFESVFPRPQVSIRPIPSGTMVHVNGREVGTAPVDLPIGVGRHKLRLQRQGYWPLTRTFNIAPGDQRTLVDTLEASQGMLVVNSRPEGASIHVNDHSVGTTPDSTTLQTGTHNVRLDRDGFQSAHRTVTVNAGSKTRLSVDLKRALRVALAGDHPDEIENPTLTRDGDRLVVTYNLVGDADTYEIALQLAPSGEKTFAPIPKSVSGDVGEKVSPGRNKQIVWNALEDMPEGLDGTDNRLRVDVESDDRTRLYWVLGGTLAAGAAILLGR